MAAASFNKKMFFTAKVQNRQNTSKNSTLLHSPARDGLHGWGLYIFSTKNIQ